MRKVAAYAVPCSAMRKFQTELYHGGRPRVGVEAGFRRSLGRFVWLFLGPRHSFLRDPVGRVGTGGTSGLN